jgi:reversibly glycosylated polypeptide/UDP-arabinopyranose mutase
MKKTLVIPSIREECFNKFMKAWYKLGDWDDVVLVEDNPNKTFTCIDIHHLSWGDIQDIHGENSWIFSKRDSAIRSAGFITAYRNEADYILTLDDDCYPFSKDEPIFEGHIKRMNSHKKWVASCGIEKTRGYPYKNEGKLESVVANMGLWTNVGDFDAVQSLAYPQDDYFHPNVSGNKLIPQGQYFPLCGMSFCFKREVAPLAYFPLMGQDQPYSRFDDIWFGIIFKKIIDHLGWNVSVGEPFVNHQKASNVFTNLKKEAPGIEANEHYWSIIDNKCLTKDDPKECMIELGSKLEGDYDIYISKLGKAMQIWANMF